MGGAAAQVGRHGALIGMRWRSEVPWGGRNVAEVQHREAQPDGVLGWGETGQRNKALGQNAKPHSARKSASKRQYKHVRYAMRPARSALHSAVQRAGSWAGPKWHPPAQEAGGQDNGWSVVGPRSPLSPPSFLPSFCPHPPPKAGRKPHPHVRVASVGASSVEGVAVPHAGAGLAGMDDLVFCGDQPQAHGSIPGGVWGGGWGGVEGVRVRVHSGGRGSHLTRGCPDWLAWTISCFVGTSHRRTAASLRGTWVLGEGGCGSALGGGEQSVA